MFWEKRAAATKETCSPKKGSVSVETVKKWIRENDYALNTTMYVAEVHSG